MSMCVFIDREVIISLGAALPRRCFRSQFTLKAICVDALLPDLESSQSHLDKVKPTLQVISIIKSLQFVPASRQILAGGTPAGRF